MGVRDKVRNEIDNREVKSIAAWSMVTPVLGVGSNRLNVPVPIQYLTRWDIGAGSIWQSMASLALILKLLSYSTREN